MAGDDKTADRSVVAIPISNLMRAAWISGFGSGVSTMLGTQGMTFEEANAAATEVVKGFENDAKFTLMVVEEIDAIMLDMLPRMGTVIAKDDQTAAKESRLIADAVRNLAAGDQ